MTKANDKRIRDEMSEKIIETAERLATENGAERLTVRKILVALSITGRVFYNRFHDVDEVLSIAYRNTAKKIRDGISISLDPKKDFFDQVTDIVAGTLRLSYENKKSFSRYVFESDSSSEENYTWWKERIMDLIAYGRKNGHLRDVDPDITSYAVWCFIRGYNADALDRGLPMEKAISDFKYSFRILLEGMRA